MVVMDKKDIPKNGLVINLWAEMVANLLDDKALKISLIEGDIYISMDELEASMFHVFLMRQALMFQESIKSTTTDKEKED